MSSSSAIEWTDVTWNPVTGCDRVSPGCAHCYALELAPRLRAMGVQRYVDARAGGRSSGPAFGVTLHPDVLDHPLRWRKPRRVFVNSMSDLFHEEVPDEFIGQVLNRIYFAQEHSFQVLTKRPERMRDCLRRYYRYGGLDGTGNPSVLPSSGYRAARDGDDYVLHNLWLGVSIENRRFVARADVLRETPAAVRFISAEPLLGPLVYDAIEGTPRDIAHRHHSVRRCWYDRHDGPELELDGIDWLIVGGESGSQHRPISEEWVRDLRDHARSAGTAFFLKQWGGRTPKAGGRELDGRTWDEMPGVARGAA